MYYCVSDRSFFFCESAVESAGMLAVWNVSGSFIIHSMEHACMYVPYHIHKTTTHERKCSKKITHGQRMSSIVQSPLCDFLFARHIVRSPANTIGTTKRRSMT
eukprot:GHVQ01039346.1.p2 GENE.GHVQ01039346.1~~GHVQ01039346.1.p2  ORF type:complete len:103 (+),score=9.07 GHVQ01039346.1:1977-2285(+)